MTSRVALPSTIRPANRLGVVRPTFSPKPRNRPRKLICTSNSLDCTSLRAVNNARGCADLGFKIGLVGKCHAANGVGLEVFPDQFVWIAVGQIGREEKNSRSLPCWLSTKALVFLAMWAGPRSTIKKIARLAPAIRRLRNSMKTAAFTPPFSLIMNRIWPRAVIAQDQAHAMARTCGFDDGGFAPLTPRAARMVIGAHV